MSQVNDEKKSSAQVSHDIIWPGTNSGQVTPTQKEQIELLKQRVKVVATAFGSTILFFLIGYLLRHVLDPVLLVLLGVTFILGCALYAAYLSALQEIRFGSAGAMAKAERLQGMLSDKFFVQLVEINFNHIQAYYLQTQEHAKRSFRLACSASVAGFVTTLLGAILLYFQGGLWAGVVTLSAGAIAEFIAATFFYLYNRTVLKMGDYHRKLVLTQNVAVALKVTEGMPEKERFEAQRMLVDSLTKNINLYLAGWSRSSRKAMERSK